MKKSIFFILLFVSAIVSAQKSINEYQYAIVPVKFDWMSKDNQYRVSTLTKMKLNEIGFKAYYDNEVVPEEVASGRCDKLYVNVEKNSSFLATKLTIVFKDCQNVVVFKSAPGTSKKKDFDEAYREAMDNAFQSIKAVNYKYSGQSISVIEKKPQEGDIQAVQNSVKETTTTAVKAVNSNTARITVEPTANGYLVIDESSATVKFKLLKTTTPDVCIATSQGRQGVLIKKAGNWFFEYYANDKLVSEQTDLKF